MALLPNTARILRRTSGSSLTNTLMLLPKGAFYFGTRKHDEVVKCAVFRILTPGQKSGKRLHPSPRKGRPIHPPHECLILTHILQMDFVKWPIQSSRMAGYITTSPISFHSTSEPKKMWVRIRDKSQGVLPSTRGLAQ